MSLETQISGIERKQSNAKRNNQTSLQRDVISASQAQVIKSKNNTTARNIFTR